MISIIDCGIGNLKSVEQGLQKLGYEISTTTDKMEIEKSKAIILPGVGAFDAALESIKVNDLEKPIIDFIASGKPLLGICLGLQLLFEESEEAKDHKGLGILKGRIKKFVFPKDSGYKIPHMGWNDLQQKKESPLFEGIKADDKFYFVHSYYVESDDHDIVSTTTNHGIDFVSSICRDNVFGTQFHPEKSGTIGLKILDNFAKLSEV